MIRIYVENYELDINESFTHQITYAVNDLQNLDSKSTAFTKTIVLPGTAKNNKIFGNIFEFANSNFTDNANANVGYNFNASKSAKARIESNGLSIMKGVLRLLEIIVDGHLVEYEVALFGELGGFISKLAANKLTENDDANNNLDFTSLNHVYSAANITNSWNNANAGTGYYYPLIDYGNVSYNIPSTNPTTSVAKKDYQYTAFRPAFFVRDIIDKIVTKAGYTWESNFFNTNFFKRLIVPNNEKGLYRHADVNFITATLTTDLRASSPNGAIFTVVKNVVYDSTTLTNFTQSLGVFTYNQNSTTIKLKGTLSGVHKEYNSAAKSSFQIFKNNTPISSQVLPNSTAEVAFSLDYDVDVDLVLNDTITLVIVSSSVAPSFGQPALPANSSYIQVNDLSLSGKKEPPGYVEYQIGDTIIMNDIIPKNILQKDFFTSIMKMFNLMVTEDKYVEKKLIIEPYVDFYDLDRTSYLDWSLKVDRSKPIHIKPMSEINARYYQFNYKPDSDYFNDLYKKKWNQGYGDIVYDNALEFAKETQKNEVIFAATPLVGYQGKDKIVSTIFKKQNAVEDRTESIIRILQAKKITGVTSWKILNNSTTLSTQTAYGYAGHFDDPDVPAADVNFGATNELYFTLVAGALSNNLFNTYYSSYLAEITDKDSRLITTYMKLQNTDVFELDFGKFIWIDGVLYRLSKIYDYAENELCKVELLRVIYSIY